MSLRATLALLFMCAALPAQVTERPLTNSDVAGMLRSGLPEGTIILTIQLAGDREMTAFNTSPAALIDLRNNGASEAVLNVVLTAPNIPQYEPSNAVPGLPPARGLYYQSPGGFSALDSVVLFPELRARVTTAKAFWRPDDAREERHYIVEGRQARVRVTGARPAFYLRNQAPPKGWYMLRLKPGTDHREFSMRIPDALSYNRKAVYDSGPPMPVEATVNASDVVTLRPSADLMPGQYLLFRLAPGQDWFIEGYAFEVGG